MKQLLHYLPVILGIIIVSGAILMTGGFSVGIAGEGTGLFADTQPATSLETTSRQTTSVPVLNTAHELPPALVRTITTATSTATTTSTSSSSTTSPTTTTKPTPERIPAGGYSSIRIFLDKQRLVLYRFDTISNSEYPALAFICSTGKSSTPTPKSPNGGNSPFYLKQRTTLTRFSSPKYVGTCLVRYAIQVQGSTWIHAVPYSDPYGPKGKIELRKNACDLGAYRALGRTASSGCIRLCLRDAKYLYSIFKQGMPCYIVASSKGYEIPAARGLPSASGSRGWDPTDPERPGYVAPPPVVEPTPPTSPSSEKPTEKPSEPSQSSVPPSSSEPSLPPTVPDPPTDPTDPTDASNPSIEPTDGPGGD